MLIGNSAIVKYNWKITIECSDGVSDTPKGKWHLAGHSIMKCSSSTR